MSIELSNGYLKLHMWTIPGSVGREGEMPPVWVKGNMIACVRGNAAGGTMVTVGQNGWSLQVVEEAREIIEATAASYKQVMGK